MAGASCRTFVHRTALLCLSVSAFSKQTCMEDNPDRYGTYCIFLQRTYILCRQLIISLILLQNRTTCQQVRYLSPLYLEDQTVLQLELVHNIHRYYGTGFSYDLTFLFHYVAHGHRLLVSCNLNVYIPIFHYIQHD